MTRQQYLKWKPTLDAWAIEGKVLQFKHYLDSAWIDYLGDSPSFLSSSVELRIKPEPREWWIIAIFDELAGAVIMNSKGQAEEFLRITPNGTITHVREVLE